MVDQEALDKLQDAIINMKDIVINSVTKLQS